MPPSLPRPVRVGSLSYAVAAVAAALVGVMAVACWWRVGATADSFLALPLPPRDVAAVPAKAASLRLALGGSAVAAILIAGAAGLLAAGIQRPAVAWIRTAGLWVSFLGGAALIAGVLLVPVDRSEGTTVVIDLAAVAHTDLGSGPLPLADWYPTVFVPLGWLAFAALVAAGFQLSRTSMADYSRPASHLEDERWTSFVQRQQERQQLPGE
ncbi:hypothetical protein ACWT_5242 [Actinoplanes sp. SE50]|uniref:hypothetical protein n=1 Tax=unclassified Actinoplanes TaxID=2626549 RepID=UPI00023EBDA0|nr:MULTISPECIES: hypothetical protein [unclassified Actinoplanes]AEV86260.1 hypothetical protein ACPL_5373 [Actinoplanes sp. SE50/110]ATO84657.1 hypothetical protein ACWT_5242 [Actinoplanes sp. SE50]SLM02067.1 hypothetical protein ACSP50_5305 [Actinoplanes sp. SE50/110]